jgi:hypothetical protein
MNKTAISASLLSLVVLAAGCASAGPAPAPEAPAAVAPPPTAPTATAGAAAPAAGGGVYSGPQADRGRSAFRASCAECHYSSEFRGSQFQFSWGRRSVADLYVEIVRNMPEDAPGSLEDKVYVDIVAYILQLNGFPTGDHELPADESVLEAYSMAAPSGTNPDPEHP